MSTFFDACSHIYALSETQGKYVSLVQCSAIDSSQPAADAKTIKTKTFKKYVLEQVLIAIGDTLAAEGISFHDIVALANKRSFTLPRLLDFCVYVDLITHQLDEPTETANKMDALMAEIKSENNDFSAVLESKLISQSQLYGQQMQIVKKTIHTLQDRFL